MGFFKPKVQKVQEVTPANDTSASAAEVKDTKETAAKKARLTETEGGNKGAELQASQGKSVRRIFGG